MEEDKKETIYKIERKKKALESMWNAKIWGFKYTQYKGKNGSWIHRDMMK